MSEIKFEDGIPERPVIAESDPEEYKTETCEKCVRCGKGTPKKPGYHCMMKRIGDSISPEDKACREFWSKKRQKELEALREQDVENRRKELWAIYAKKKKKNP